MGTLGTRTRNGKRAAPPRVERPERRHPAVAKLAVALKEYKEALEQQAATADVLRALSRSFTDAQPVLDAIVDHAHRLCGAVFTILYRYDGRSISVVAERGLNAKASRVVRDLHPAAPRRDHLVGRCILDRRIVHSADVANASRSPASREALMKLVPYRVSVEIPLQREGKVVGAIAVARLEPKPFSKQEIALLKTFGDQAVIALQNAKMFREIRERNAELKQSLDFQGATSEILASISGSIAQTQPVFEAIVRNLRALFGNGYAAVFLARDGRIEVAAAQGELDWQKFREIYPLPLDERTAMGQAMLRRQVVHYTPVRGNPEVPALTREIAEKYPFDSMLCAPMMREGKVMGGIAVTRRDAVPFDEKQIALINAFAAQAVIAIENARLFNETKEALEQQTVTADILRVIAGTPTDAQPVFDAIVRNAQRITAAKSAALLLRRDADFFVAAYSIPGLAEMPAELRTVPLDRERNFPSRVILDGQILHISDWEADDILAHEKAVAKAFGFGSGVQVPLMRKGTGIGALVVSRATKGPFAEKEIALLQAFADQAVIAIENVRLFNETKEALERQTATAEILRAIASSHTNTQPVFDAIVASALKIFDGYGVGILIADGEHIQMGSAGGILDMAEARARYPVPLNGESVSGRAMLERAVVNIGDIEAAEVPELARLIGRALGYRSICAAPMTREGSAIGAIAVVRKAAEPLPEKDVALLRTFADQAVIAIENVRLIKELESKNGVLTRALAQQTATAEILRAMSSSPNDVQPVFDVIVASGLRLLGGYSATLTLLKDGILELAAYSRTGGEGDVSITHVFPTMLERLGPAARAVRERCSVSIADIEQAPGVLPEMMAAIKARGWRSALFVPMLREGTALGVITITRRDPGLFAADEVALLETFARQAVIAIENVRLFNELQQRTDALTKSVGQLTALGEVGQAIGSTLELERVLKMIAAHAVRLTGLDAGVIYEYDEASGAFELRASKNFDEESVAGLRGAPIRVGEGAVGRAVETREPSQVGDTHSAEYPARLRELLDAQGFRAVLAVPLAREGQVLGALMVLRKAPGTFAPEVVELLRTFASQSALGIQNARLYREIEQKSRQLEAASRHKSQFLASMSHELRTPLNAILGFNEMISDGIYGEPPQDMKEPLQNIQSSGSHLLRLINNVLDLAKIEAGRMELALSDYSVHDTVASVHSTLKPLAAEKGLAFVVEVPCDLPPAFGDPGRLSQCLINLAGNALKFTKEGRVSIEVAHHDGLLRFSICDTGIGIPSEKIATLFTEFKQTDATIASEYGGTGLGLSITKKFIEMHSGRIWVESELGKGSAFRFEIPARVGQ